MFTSHELESSLSAILELPRVYSTVWRGKINKAAANKKKYIFALQVFYLIFKFSYASMCLQLLICVNMCASILRWWLMTSQTKTLCPDPPPLYPNYWLFYQKKYFSWKYDLFKAIHYLSMLIHIRMNDERKSPKVRKKAIMRQAASPAFHWTVAAQPISNGIISSVTLSEKHSSQREYII